MTVPADPNAAPQAPAQRLRRRDFVVAGAAAAFAAFMVGMAYAAVPLYDWFCRTTGFGGTTQVSDRAPERVLDRKVTIRFDANVGAGLPWRFAPEVRTVEARIGEVVTVEYHVTNLAARETLGIAGYNVTPLELGAYFHKINCFCFTDQSLGPGERRTLTVVFYVDPAIVNDRDGAGVNTITLSYSFYPQRAPRRPVAEVAGSGRAGRI